ncbi:MAG: right-handed parallel beta-helix repeat-containing protein [candidate division FCPU426 bacterium]
MTLQPKTRLLWRGWFPAIAGLCLLGVLPMLAGAAAYYVRSDGDDANTGLSDLQAWKTTDKVNSFTFQTGDDVYFRCNDAWVIYWSPNPVLTVDWNGSAADPAVIGAYYLDGGTEVRGVQGNKPDFDGNSLFPTSGEYATLMNVSNRQYVTIENLRIRRSLARGLGVFDSANMQILNVDTEHTFNEGIVLYQVTDSLAQGCDISFSSERHLTYYGGNSAGFSLNQNNLRVVLRQCRLHENYGNGIFIFTRNQDCIVENNAVYNSASGYNIILANGSSNCDLRNNLVYGTTVTAFLDWQNKPSSGIVAADWGSTYKLQNNRYYNNLIAGCDTGIYIQSDTTLQDTFVYNNTFVDNFTNLYLEGPFANCAVRNNIVWCLTTGGADPSLPISLNAYSGLALDHNFWSVTPTAAAQGAGDIIGASPKLKKPSGWRTLASGAVIPDDFNLQADSPAIDAAWDAGPEYAFDVSGTARPKGKAWDLGAWENIVPAQMLQLSWVPVPAGLLYLNTLANVVGQFNCLAFNFDLLQSLRLENRGTALAGRDISLVKFWRQNGGGAFNPAAASPLGAFAPVGPQTWTWSSSPPGVTLSDSDRIYFTVDIPGTAQGGASCQFALPAEAAVFTYSRPLELTELANPYSQGIQSTVLLTLDVQSTAPVNALVGQPELPLGRVTLTNVSGETKSIFALRMTGSDKQGVPLPFDRVFDRLWLQSGSAEVASLSGDLLAIGVFSFTPALVFSNQDSLVLELCGQVKTAPTAAGFRLEIPNNQSINGGQILAEPVSSKTFPLPIAEVNLRQPSLAAVFSAFPNPFHPAQEALRIAYYVEQPARVRLSIWTTGQDLVRELADAEQEAGIYETPWDGRNGRAQRVKSGVYLLRIEVRPAHGGVQTAIRKIAVAN